MSYKVEVQYNYHNSNKGFTRLWMSLPMAKISDALTPRPENTSIDAGENMISYFILKENEHLNIQYSEEVYKKDEQIEITQAERNYYLRTGILVQIDPEITLLAETITADTTTIMNKVKLLFYYVVENFKYVYPPKSRGVKSFLQSKKGDCGEYSFLFTSLCRSIGVPCRTLIGSWANGKMSAHVWNEFFVEEIGWVPVDCSMAYMQRYKKSQFLFSNIQTLAWEKYFGNTDAQRIVFSKDAEIMLNPPYKDITKEEIEGAPQKPLSPFKVNERPFYWGYQSLNGTAPYIQPVYLQFDKLTLNSKPTKDGKRYLGSWKIKEKGYRRFFYLLKMFSFYTFITCFLINLIINSNALDVVRDLAILLTGISFVARKERTVLFSVLTIFFLLPLLSSITKLF